MFKHSVPTSKEKQHLSITKINWLTLFKEIITAYSENHMKYINTLCGQNEELMIVNASGTYSYDWGLKGHSGVIDFI
jgi:hypothetical protein